MKENGIGDGDGDEVVDDEGADALSSNDPLSSPDDIFSKVPLLDLGQGRCFSVLRSCVSQISVPSVGDESI